ncbi:MAG: hypothetical protein AAB448_04520, partial [Patescibacteria group bacterium]
SVGLVSAPESLVESVLVESEGSESLSEVPEVPWGPESIGPLSLASISASGLYWQARSKRNAFIRDLSWRR